ncbi:hypothetical protein, partial [Azospirillum palustre]
AISPLVLGGLKWVEPIIHKPAARFHTAGPNVAVLPKDSRGRRRMPGRMSPLCQFLRPTAVGPAPDADSTGEGVAPAGQRWRQRLRSAVPVGNGAGGSHVNILIFLGYCMNCDTRIGREGPWGGHRLAERRRSDDPPQGRFPPDSPPIPYRGGEGWGGIRSIIRQNGDVRRDHAIRPSRRRPRIFRHNGDVWSRIFRHNGDTSTRTAEGAARQVLDSSARIQPGVREMPSTGDSSKTVDRRATPRTHFKKRAKTALMPSSCAHASSWPAPRAGVTGGMTPGNVNPGTAKRASRRRAQ